MTPTGSNLMGDLLDEFRAAVGPRHVLTGGPDMSPFVSDWRGKFHGTAAAVVKPGSTEEVARIISLCAAADVAVVPQGGNTSLTGAAVPTGPAEVVINLARMNRIRSVDPVDNTIVAESGVILKTLQDAAEDVGRMFPISLAAEGSAQVGGIISTNAGGIQVLRFGMTRDLVLGLEVVLPDGRIWQGLRRLRKDNTGLDLRQWFIGAEGTLGIVTAASLRIVPSPGRIGTAMVKLADPATAIALLRHLEAEIGDVLLAFELIKPDCFDLLERHMPDVPLPFRDGWAVLLEVSTGRRQFDLEGLMEEVLAEQIDRGLILDAVVATSGSQRANFWRLRESITEAERAAGVSVKNDISVPVSAIPDFVAAADKAVKRFMPDARPIAFGHAADGNIHYNILLPEGGDSGQAEALASIVSGVAVDHGGSISAEHGIGLARTTELPGFEGAVAYDLMLRMKRSLDPRGIMNPGKIFPPRASCSRTESSGVA